MELEMANRSGMYCPVCEQSGVKNELMQETYIFQCVMGHKFESYGKLMSMNPKMIPLQFIELPQPGTEKVEIFLRPETWERFCAKYPERKYVTIGSMIDLLLDGSVLVIEGKDAKTLRDLYKIKNGEEIVALAAAISQKDAEIQTLQNKVDTYERIMAGAIAASKGEIGEESVAS
jgi:hypothetical protein